MKILILTITFFIILFNMEIYAQVSISPEIGLNYRPYILEGVNTYSYHKAPEPYFNVLGEVYFRPSLLMQVRAGYVFRNNTQTIDLIFGPYKGSTFMNQELNVNLDLLYRFLNNFKLGLGAGIIHKLNSHVVVDFTSSKLIYGVDPKVLKSVNFLIAYQFGKFEVNLRFFYLINSELENGSYLRIKDGYHGLSSGVSYRLFTSKKGR